MTPHVITYRSNGKWLNHYLSAKSIEAAERSAAIIGMRGEGFEVVEVIDAKG